MSLQLELDDIKKEIKTLNATILLLVQSNAVEDNERTKLVNEATINKLNDQLSKLETVRDKLHDKLPSTQQGLFYLTTGPAKRTPDTIDKLNSLLGIQLTQNEQHIFFTKFGNLTTSIDRNLINVPQARQLVKKIRTALDSGTVLEMSKRGYTFDGLLAVGSAHALLYKVIEISTYRICCAKVYSQDDSYSFDKELRTSNTLHEKETLANIVNIVKYTSLECNHVSMDKKSLALLMPLFPMSLSEIIEANHGIEVPFDRFLIITRGLLLAGSLFHKSGLAHCDIKPANVMIADGEPVLIDLGAVRKFGETAEEHTRFYGLDADRLCVEPLFDLCCIIVTLAQCFMPDFEVKHRTRDSLKLSMENEKDTHINRHVICCVKLFEFKSCTDAFDWIMKF